MIEIVFLEPEKKHPNSQDETIYQVAKKLEQDYGLCEKFVKYIENKLYSRAIKIAERQLKDFGKTNKKIIFNQLSDYLKIEWRKFITQEKHYIITKASLDRGGKSFIDTKSYYRNMEIAIKER